MNDDHDALAQDFHNMEAAYQELKAAVWGVPAGATMDTRTHAETVKQAERMVAALLELNIRRYGMAALKKGGE